jgi:REP element-mobilizing transposase RayT
MTYDPNVHRRRSIRLKGFDYSSAGAYFVTVCTHERLCTLGTVADCAVRLSPAGDTVRQIWESLGDRFPGVETDAFVVMPNHVHGILTLVGVQFIAPGIRHEGQRTPLLGEVVRAFKAASTRLIRTSGFEEFAWQRGYYEHVVRNETDLRRIREYIEANPMLWVDDPENPAVGPEKAHDELTGRLRAR